MENSYGIGVTNKYSLFLDDDGDPFEALANAKKETTDKKTKVSGKENKNSGKNASGKSVKKVSAKENDIAKEPQQSDGPSARRGGGFGVPAQSREQRNNYRNTDERPDNREGGPPARFGHPSDGGERGRGRGRGGFGGRGRGRGRGAYGDNRGKREFDRQSGSDRSGVKAVDKRDGSGRGNWGTVEDELAAFDGPPEPAEEAPEPAAAAEPADEPQEGPQEPQEPQELTLDEWRRQQEPRSKPQFNVRRAGEGEKQQWKNTFQLKKKNEDSEEEDEEEDSDEEQVRHGRPKRYVEDIQFTFSDSRRGGRGRGRGAGGEGGFRGRGGRGGGGEDGSRGGYRGRGRGAADDGDGAEDGGYRGGFRGGYRGGRGAPRGAGAGAAARQHAPKVDDEKDFPSLG